MTAAPLPNCTDLVAAVEAVLFVAGEPITVEAMARVLQISEEQVLTAVGALRQRLDESGSALQVIAIAGGYQLCTRPTVSEFVARLLAREQGKLSRAALETLAIIAYRQPITQPEIEAIRGVACASVLRTLLDRNLICEAGRKSTVGRPILYRTTQSFLHYFALRDLSELPPLDAPTSTLAEDGGA